MTTQTESNPTPAPIPARRLPSWIDSFVEFGAQVAAPREFLIWAAVSALSASLERRAWVHTNAGDLYPNLFVLLVGAPGTGKDQAINRARGLWGAAQQVNLAPISMTGKGMLDELADPAAQRQHIESGNWINTHSLILAVPEFGVLLPGHDLQFLSILNSLYECPMIFEERLRKQEERFRIERPHICILAGTQPNFLGAVLPETAFGMGFMARMIMIYNPTPVRRSLFGNLSSSTGLEADLLHDLRQLSALRGEFILSPAAQNAIELWHAKGCLDDAPVHSRLRHYNSRRILHLLKLSMAFSVSESNSLRIEVSHWRRAHETLLAAESAMPEIFKEMSAGTCNSVIEETTNFCIGIRGAIKESAVTTFLSQRIPAYQVDITIQTMIRSGILIPDALNLPGQRTFKVTAPGKVEEGN